MATLSPGTYSIVAGLSPELTASWVWSISIGVGVTGIVLTKLDGTAKGGVVIAIADELGIPVQMVGLGEGLEDLSDFDSETFTKALFEGD